MIMISGTKKKVILKTEEIFDEEACNSLSEITLGNFFPQTLGSTYVPKFSTSMDSRAKYNITRTFYFLIMGLQ